MRIDAQLAEGQRDRLLPNSVANNKIDNLVEDLTPDDIARETYGRIIQLGVAPRVRQEVRRLVGDILRADIHADLGRLNAESTAMAVEAAVKLDAAGGGPLGLQPEALKESAAWKALQESIHLDSRSRGELAEKGLRERIMEFIPSCRTPILLLGIVSPFFALWPELREPLLKLSPFLLIGGAFWAYIGLREDKHRIVEREMMRLRDTLRSEIRRLYEEVLGDWSKRARQHLHGVVARLGQQVDEHVKNRLAQAARELARERAEVQDRMRVVDHRMRELGAQAQEVGRVRRLAAEARQTLERGVREALRRVEEAVGFP
jgi:hypothetical protein